jgi:hypothetical protein
MEQMIAFCGLSCSGCDAFPANQKTMTPNERKTVAEQWSLKYGHGHTIKLEDIRCEGCLSDGGKLWSYCSSCEIRNCGKTKNIKNCAWCADYACEKLNKFFKMAPTAKANLEEIRKGL